MSLSDTLSSSAHGIARAALWALKGGYHLSTLSGGQTLDETFPAITGFDPGGSTRIVVLDGTTAGPGEASNHGLLRVIVNRADGAEDLTVNDADGSTIGTVSQNELGIFYQDEDDGWTLVFILTGALS